MLAYFNKSRNEINFIEENNRGVITVNNGVTYVKTNNVYQYTIDSLDKTINIHDLIIGILSLFIMTRINHYLAKVAIYINVENISNYLKLYHKFLSLLSFQKLLSIHLYFYHYIHSKI